MRPGLAILLAGGATALALAASPGPPMAPAVPDATASFGSGRGGVKKKSVGRFRFPVHVAAAPGVRALYVVEQPGRVRVVKKRKRGRPFLDIRGKVRFSAFGEEGLLSIAFHPDFRANRLAYLYYTTNEGNNVVAEVRARRGNPLVARRHSLRTVLVIRHPGESNHNGGQIEFGPDGFLYVGSGDGGGAEDPDNSAQDRGSLLGKILRIDPRRNGSARYSVPRGNPFVGDPGRDEVYAFGLRNPYRFSIDPNRGRPRLAIGDVGQDRFEEIDYEGLGASKGANFGWNDFEGFVRTSFGDPPAPPHLKPVFVYGTHSRGRCAVVGGVVVRGGRLRTLRGRYLFGDFCDGVLRSIPARTSRVRGAAPLGLRVPALSSIAFGRGGKLYATSLEGPVYRLKRR